MGRIFGISDFLSAKVGGLLSTALSFATLPLGTLAVATLAFATLAVATLAVPTVAADQGPNQVDVTLTEFKLSMTATSIPAGVPVTFAATNNGDMMHEVVLEKSGAVDQPFEMNGRETEIEDIAPGATKSATWTITQPGEYQLACHLPAHFDAGMVERFTVTAATGSGQGQTGAAMQVAAPSAENAGEHEDRSVAATADPAAPAPAMLPQTGGAVGKISAFGWLVAGVAATLLAVYVTFRWLVKQIASRE